MNGKKRKTAVLAMAAVLSVMMIASPLAVMAEETAPAAPAITRDGNVQKETAPAIRLPENLRAKEGTALKDVALPEPWIWADDSTVITAGTAEYPARLCVDDTTYDYSKVEGYNAGGHYVERMVAVTAEAAKATNPVKGKPRGLPGAPPATYDVGDIEINADNFPDAEFQDYIRNTFGNGDGKLSAAEIADIKAVDVYDNPAIQNLTGIEHFTALEILDCGDTGIGSLDVSRNKNLEYLNCSGTRIGSLDVSHNEKLETLSCRNTGIGSLDVSHNPNLKTLDCFGTGIGSLDVSSNKKLTDLYCNNNASLTNLTVEGAAALTDLRCNNTGIGSLDVSSNPNLIELRCENNASLTNLTVEGATALKSLWCYNTGIGSLDVSRNEKLTDLQCNANASLTSLTVEGAEALNSLWCSNTGIGSLDVNRNPNLIELRCENNASLTSLKIEGAEELETLNCSNTGIRSLDVSHNTELTYLNCSNNANLTNLTVEGATALTHLNCSNTGIGSLDVSRNTELTVLRCENNRLAYLNIGTNNKLTDVYSTGLKDVDVTVTSDSFNMADKFAGIDADAVQDVKNATYNSGTMSNYSEGTPIQYTYHCGTSSSGEVTIKVTLNITLGSTIDITENLNKTYDGTAVSAAPAVDRKGSSGKVSYKWEREKGSNTWEIINSAPTDAGTYQVTATLESDGIYKGITSEPVQFTIAKAASSISIIADLNKAYDGKAVSAAPAVHTEGSSGKVSYKWEREKSANTWEIINSAPTDAGTYQVTATLESDNNYKGITSEPVQFTISKAASSISIIADLNKAYDGTAVSAKPEVDRKGSSGEVSYKWEREKSANTWEIINSAPTDAGTYRVTATLESDYNYEEKTSESVQFTISKAANGWTGPLSITGWTYGKSPNDPTAAAKFGKASYLYSNREHGNYTDTVPSHAGRWYVKAIVAGTNNYGSLESDAVSFVIAPKDITTDNQITVPDITADTDLDELVIQDGDRALVQGTDYDVTTKRDGANVTVTITGKGNYTGTITRSYTVEEKAPSGGVKDSDNNKPDGTKTDKKTAQTGDPANVGVLAAMILLSAGCMFVLIRKKGQKK